MGVVRGRVFMLVARVDVVTSRCIAGAVSRDVNPEPGVSHYVHPLVKRMPK
jgi:hypothetical protein